MVPMRFRDIVTESPQNAQATNFRSADESWNRAFAKRQLKKSNEVLTFPHPECDLFRTGDGQKGWVLLYNKHEQKIDFALVYKAFRKNWLPSAVTSNVIWADATSPYTSRLPEQMFFDFLLARYGAVVSDGLQTDKGKRFWQRQMTAAAQQGCRIGLVNFNNRVVQWYTSQSGSFQRWLTQIDSEAWGDDDKFRGLRFEIIASKS
jgi:hypothetical protein